MAITQADLLVELSRRLGDYHASVTSGAGDAGGTTVVDSLLAASPDTRFRGWWVRLPATVTEAGKNRLVTAFTGASGTLTAAPAFAAQVGAAVAYQLHRISPALKLQALNDARVECLPRLFVSSEDTSLTVLADTYEYTMPVWAYELRQVWLQQATSPATYPYRPLLEGAEWTLAPGGGKLRLAADLAGSAVGFKLRLVGVAALSSVAVDTDSMQITQPWESGYLTCVAGGDVYRRLAMGEPERAKVYRALAGPLDREAAAYRALCQAAWPVRGL